MRHTFAGFLYELTDNAPLVCARLGHRDDDLLFEHYRSLVSKGAGLRFFSLKPPTVGNIVPMPAAATAWHGP